MNKKHNQLFLSPLLSNGMVLQRNTEVKIWGKAEPNETLTLNFRDKTYITTADHVGNWQIILKPMAAGGPWKMEISGQNDEYIIDDILVGDVWVLGGQSNMELPINRTLDLFENEVKTAFNPFIRQFTVPMVYDFHGPRTELSGGNWMAVTPQNVMDFSAVGYFFAQYLYEKYKIPIGLIQTAVGGTPVEAWLSEEAIRKFSGYEKILAQCQNDNYVNKIITTENEQMNKWYKELNEEDSGCLNDYVWSKPSYDDSSWDSFEIPNSWANSKLESINGSVWFRKEIEIPEAMLEQEAVLRMGAIVDADDTYINGVLVGKTEYQYPPRKYPIPKGILKVGKNTIVVRVISNRGIGGFVKDKPYNLIAGPYEIDLTGSWKYKIGAVMGTLPQATFFQYIPTGVFNGMIAPLKNYPIQGVIWYQGESNTDHPYNYRELFTALIHQWRGLWNCGDFPFLYVQLANFMVPASNPVESNWAQLREEQRLTLSLPNTAMAVTIDVGEHNDLHPQNKKAVGTRLALCADKLAYGQDVIHQGPLFDRIEIKENIVELYFDSIGSGLMAKGGSLQGFEVCDSNRNFYPAVAEIAGNKIKVFGTQVKQPTGVRYAWADNPNQANLYNKEGLPASPFQAYDPNC